MAFIEWSDTYSVGIRSIDNEHRRLVGLVNKLHDASLQGQGSATAPVVLNELASYTVSQWHLLKPKTIVIPALSRDPVGAGRREMTGFPLIPEMSKPLVLLEISA